MKIYIKKNQKSNKKYKKKWEQIFKINQKSNINF